MGYGLSWPAFRQVPSLTSAFSIQPAFPLMAMILYARRAGRNVMGAQRGWIRDCLSFLTGWCDSALLGRRCHQQVHVPLEKIRRSITLIKIWILCPRWTGKGSRAIFTSYVRQEKSCRVPPSCASQTLVVVRRAWHYHLTCMVQL